MKRVIAQGDLRPMAGNAEAMDDLKRILAGREAFYAKADLDVRHERRSRWPTTFAACALQCAQARGARLTPRRADSAATCSRNARFSRAYAL